MRHPLLKLSAYQHTKSAYHRTGCWTAAASFSLQVWEKFYKYRSRTLILKGLSTLKGVGPLGIEPKQGRVTAN